MYAKKFPKALPNKVLQALRKEFSNELPEGLLEKFQKIKWPNQLQKSVKKTNANKGCVVKDSLEKFQEDFPNKLPNELQKKKLKKIRRSC